MLVIETAAPGGQAGSSSKIENYLGFPTGVSGQELAARAIAQAEKFGAKMMVAHSVARLDCAKHPYKVVLDNGNQPRRPAPSSSRPARSTTSRPSPIWRSSRARASITARRTWSRSCAGDEEVIVVGGGNSAGQAAVFLSQTARKVHMLVRSGKLADTMSRYLIQRIEENPAIELHYHTEIVGLEGDAHLERVTWRDESERGDFERHDIRHVFIMAGASPRTEWLRGCVALDDKGFILTGRDLDAPRSGPALAPGPSSANAGDQPAAGLCGGRCSRRKREARGLGRGRRSDRDHLVHRALAET